MLTQIIFYLLMSVNMQRLIMQDIISKVYQDIKDIMKVQTLFFLPSISLLLIASLTLFFLNIFSGNPIFDVLCHSLVPVLIYVIIILIICLVVSKLKLNKKLAIFYSLTYLIVAVIEGDKTEADLYDFFAKISSHRILKNEDYFMVLSHLNNSCAALVSSYPLFIWGKKNYYTLATVTNSLANYLIAKLT